MGAPRLWLAPALVACAAAAPAADVSQSIPYFEQSLVVIEAENFTAVGPEAAWSPRRWGEDGGFFASTVANTFHSRRGYLHAPANASAESVATATFSVAKQDTYDVLARYETGYRFQSPFRLDIAKGAGAAPLFTKTYGYRESLKVQAFGGCPTAVGR